MSATHRVQFQSIPFPPTSSMLLVVDSKDDSQYGDGTVQVRYRYGTVRYGASKLDGTGAQSAQ